MSRCLAERSIDHIVLERGEVANSWRTERWDSLRLLTPNWQSRLPGYRYEGEHPDGYRTMAETVGFIERYAQVIAAPVHTRTNVTSVRAEDRGYRVETDRGTWHARSVVIASGACNIPRIPPVAEHVPPGIEMLTPAEYRHPGELPDGGVLVVGGSASGTQIADEIHRSGRPVTLSVGEHVRVPRVYRDRDIEWWMDACGVLDERYDEVDNLERVRNLPSLQLAGSDDRRTVDLNSLTDIGVRLFGRLARIQQGRAQFGGSLPNLCSLADLKMNRLLDRIDEWVEESGMADAVPPPERFEPTRVETFPPLDLDLSNGRIRTILWATGFRPDHSWLHVPVFDHKGRIRHDGGVVDSSGLYVIGLPFLRRRKSSLIDGAADDARDLGAHLADYLAGRSAFSEGAPARVNR
jgi:putative flavoprotein involved in K+ transport